MCVVYSYLVNVDLKEDVVDGQVELQILLTNTLQHTHTHTSNTGFTAIPVPLSVGRIF